MVGFPITYGNDKIDGIDLKFIVCVGLRGCIAIIIT